MARFRWSQRRSIVPSEVLKVFRVDELAGARWRRTTGPQSGFFSQRGAASLVLTSWAELQLNQWRASAPYLLLNLVQCQLPVIAQWDDERLSQKTAPSPKTHVRAFEQRQQASPTSLAYMQVYHLHANRRCLTGLTDLDPLARRDSTPVFVYRRRDCT